MQITSHKSVSLLKCRNGFPPGSLEEGLLGKVDKGAVDNAQFLQHALQHNIVHSS